MDGVEFISNEVVYKYQRKFQWKIMRTYKCQRYFTFQSLEKNKL